MVSAVGEPIRWVKIINASSIDDFKHCLEIPGIANNVTVSVSTQDKIQKNSTALSKSLSDRKKLSALSQESSHSNASLALAQSIKNKPGAEENLLIWLLRYHLPTKA